MRGKWHEENDAPRTQTTLNPEVRRGVPSDPRPPWVVAVAVGYAAVGVPLLGSPSLADSSAEAIDGCTLSFLQQRALEVKRKEEEAVEEAELVELEEKLAAAEGRLLEVLRRDQDEGTRVTRQTWSTLSRVDQLAVHWFLVKGKVVKRRVKRKKNEEEDETQEEMAWTFFLRALVSGSYLFDVGLASGVRGDYTWKVSVFYSCWFDSGYTLRQSSTRCRASVLSSLSVAVLRNYAWLVS